jgi:hypothetical protein
MVETSRDQDFIEEKGGIIKEDFGDEGKHFQKEEITENDWNMGLILDKKLELKRGKIKTRKPLIGRINPEEFIGEVHPEKNEERALPTGFENKTANTKEKPVSFIHQ